MTQDQYRAEVDDHTGVLPLVAQAPQFSGENAWIQAYYASVSDEDLATRPVESLIQRADLHRRVAQQRHAGQTLIHVEREPQRSVLYVVTEDVPYVVSTINTQIAQKWGGARLVVHPILRVTRDEQGGLTSVSEVPDVTAHSSGDTQVIPAVGALGETTAVESWVQVVLTRELDQEAAHQLAQDLRPVLADVDVIARDHQAMRDAVENLVVSLDGLAQQDQRENLHLGDVAATQEFLRWMLDGNFVLMGMKEYDLNGPDEELYLVSRPDTGLGLLSESGEKPYRRQLTQQAQEHAKDAATLFVTKANTRSDVHRSEFLDYIGIRRFNADGQVDGEHLMIGLFARKAYATPARETPWVKDKIQAVAAQFGFREDSHSARDLLSIMEEYPRDELLHMSIPELADVAQGVLGLDERRVTKIFVRPDLFGRFVSAVVYLPRDRYNTSVRQRISDVLMDTYGATDVDFQVRLSSSALARVFFRLRLPGDTPPPVNMPELESRIRSAVRSWPDALVRAIGAEFSGEQVREYAYNWAEAFPPAYRADYEIDEAIADLQRCEMLSGQEPEQAAEVRVATLMDGDRDQVRLNVYLTRRLTLTEMLPMEQNLGMTVLDQKPYEITPADGREFQLYDFGVELPAGVDPVGPPEARTEDLIEEVLCAVLSGQSESDALDRLVLVERLHWRTIAVLRAYVKYLLQLGVPHSFEFMAQTLLSYPGVTRAVVELFETSFDPDRFLTHDGAPDHAERAAARKEARAAVSAALEEVPTLDADRFLRTLVEVVEATQRTNAYQTDRPTIALKLNPQRISAAPLPRPQFEIWVWSPRVEGTHLRFGPVSRGGLRWSDRREDFRTEVLGLVKAQMVKNAVIIPNGAKGCFFPKQLPDPGVDRGAWAAEGEEAYKEFVGALLDVTDNLEIAASAGTGDDDAAGSPDRTVPPARTVRRDGDDSYLVVAADKGTARFSDTANAISLERGFWLGDAFASGGSVGYDHKAMGITARGAWESVKRHFFELGHDTQTQDFTVVGVGDMSGDVFGNGMLLSEHIKLVAAFDHRDIFLDPNPDPAVSYAERERLFGLARSSWQDYDSAKISVGGGVFSREAKSVPISPEIRTLLDLPESTTQLSPIELMRAILQAPADLFYNGGIGTYIKGAEETHAEVGDKSNDAIRVDGSELRVKVVGEGGNLGATQRGRIEAARNGVLINTDAIDNSGGVESSDREVNIKILVDRMVTAGRLEVEARAEFIESMTDDVADLVLRTNVAQNVTLTVDRWKAADYMVTYERLMDWLGQTADLDRAIEFLPDTETMEQRIADGDTMTSPELSVLMAYAKIQLSEALIDSDLANDPWTSSVVDAYFPAPVRQRFGADLQAHPLRREILCTMVANHMINVGGASFAFRAMDETSCTAGDLAKAFLATVAIFDVDPYLDQVAHLPAEIPTELWVRMLQDQRRLVDRSVRWLLSRDETSHPIGDVIERYAPIAGLRSSDTVLLGHESASRDDELLAIATRQGVPEGLAREWSWMLDSYPLLDVVRLGTQAEEDLEVVGRVYFLLYDRFNIESLLKRIGDLPQNTRWEALARISMREDVYSTLVAMVAQALRVDGASPEDRVEAWEAASEAQLARLRSTLEDIAASNTGDPAGDLAALSVALRTMRAAVQD
ncbi:NAD-glutamate dehydrogenase [Kocuria sp.]|uniref:NAD-glutamate dehydrogenase n=1 Tax=Kocuria sp. TaxID=1871328 RepID=UPI0026E03600|nr:NAD-glutamate dehydrogenase [Kocuria sp.]MDO5617826.1 NAD-glutamate dehydrogenase [Kocuria sp.]